MNHDTRCQKASPITVWPSTSCAGQPSSCWWRPAALALSLPRTKESSNLTPRPFRSRRLRLPSSALSSGQRSRPSKNQELLTEAQLRAAAPEVLGFDLIEERYYMLFRSLEENCGRGE